MPNGTRRDQSISGGDNIPTMPSYTYGPRDQRWGMSRSAPEEERRKRYEALGITGGVTGAEDLYNGENWFSQDAYNNLMGIFAQQPAYQIPQEVFDIMSLSTQTASTLANLYTQQREDVLTRLQGEQATALDLLGLSKYQQISDANQMMQQMASVYGEGFQQAISTLGESRIQQLAMAGQTGQNMLNSLMQGYSTTRNILQSSRGEQLSQADIMGQMMSQQLGQGFGEALGTVERGRAEQMGMIEQMGGQMLGAYERGYQEQVGTLRGSRAEQLRQAGVTEKQMLKAYQEQGEAGLDILAQKAYGGLPGETQYLENLQAGTAAAVSNLTRRAGGGGGALGAIADVYTGQQEQLRNLEAARAQYQAEGMGELAGARMQYGQGLAAIRGQGGAARLGVMSDIDRQIAAAQGEYGAGQADIYGRLGEQRLATARTSDERTALLQAEQGVRLADVTGRTGEARLGVMQTMDQALAGVEERMGTNVADVYGKTGEMQIGIMGEMDRTMAAARMDYGAGMADIFRVGGESKIGIRSSMDQALASARTNMAAQYADAYRGTTQDIGSAIQTGTNMINQAMGNIADQKAMAWQTNYLQPYKEQRQYLIEEMRRTDPTDWYTNFLAQMAGATYGAQAQGIAGWSTGVDMVGNALNTGMGNYFQNKYMDLWSGQNNRVTNPIQQNYTPAYNYPGTSRDQYIPSVNWGNLNI